MAEPSLDDLLGDGAPQGGAPVIATPTSVTVPQDGSPAVWTLLGEAGGDPANQLPVAATVFNRMAAKGVKDPDAIVTDPGNGYEAWQDPTSRAKLIKDYPVGSPAYQRAQLTLEDVQNNGVPDQYKSLDSYYSPDAMKALGRVNPDGSVRIPDWAAKAEAAGQHGVNVGGNLFYSTGIAGPPAPSGEPDLDHLVNGPPSAGQPNSASQPPPFTPTPAQIAGSDSGDAQWPVYDSINNVGRNKDGSLAYVGKPVAYGPGGPGQVETIVGDASIDAADKAAWLKAHPDDPANHPHVPQVQPGDNSDTLEQPDAFDNVSRGVDQGLANVGNSLRGADAAIRSNPIGDAVLRVLIEPNALPVGVEKAQLGQETVNRNANDLGYGHSASYGLGKFGGELAGTLPLMAATDGAAGGLVDAGLSGTKFAPVADFLAGQAPGRLLGARGASLAVRGAVQGGEAAALTSAGSSAPLSQQVAQGAGAGGVLGLGVPAATGAARGVANFAPFVKNAFLPLTDAGRGQVADRMMRDIAEGGPTASKFGPFVEGVTPTTAQATGNPSLAVNTRVVRDLRPNEFGAQETVNDSARAAHLEGVTGTPATIDQATAVRSAIADPMLNKAFASAVPANATPIISAIDSIASSPAGQLDPVAGALKNLRSKIVSPPPEMSPEELADFNRKVSATIGQNSPVLDQATMSAAKATTGKIYQDVASRNNINVDQPFLEDIATVGSQARELGLDPSQIGALDGQIAKITDLAQKNGGVIPGDAYKAMTENASTLSRLQSGGGTLGSLAGDIRDALNGALERSAAPEDVALVQKANSQWKNMRTLEGPVLSASRAMPGAPQVTPDAVLGAVTRNYKNYAYTGGADLGGVAESALKAQGAKGPVVQTDTAQLHAIQQNLTAKIDALSKSGDPVSQQSAQALQAVRYKLVEAIDSAAPGYGQYVATHDALTAPIKAQTYLQSRTLTDQRGVPTLAGVNRTLDAIDAAQRLPGPNDAKSVSPEQIAALRALQSDLLLKSNESALGKPMGSSTFQNLATNNFLAKGGAPLAAAGAMAAHHPVLAPLALAARWLYGAQNSNVLDKLAERMIDPELGLAALAPLTSKAANAFFASPAVRGAAQVVNDNYLPTAVLSNRMMQQRQRK